MSLPAASVCVAAQPSKALPQVAVSQAGDAELGADDNLQQLSVLWVAGEARATGDERGGFEGP
jgi:hypothetical protein